MANFSSMNLGEFFFQLLPNTALRQEIDDSGQGSAHVLVQDKSNSESESQQ
jgi:hypothetical protein